MIRNYSGRRDCPGFPIGSSRLARPWSKFAYDPSGHDQIRSECVSNDPARRAGSFVIDDRDAIYAEDVDRTLEAMGLAVLKTPAAFPRPTLFVGA